MHDGDAQRSQASELNVDWAAILSLIAIVAGFCFAGFVLLIVF
jgi:hypothetical protein